MDSITELVAKLSLNDFNIGDSYWIDVTHVNNPHSFYVRPTSYRTFMPLVQAYGDPADASDLCLSSMVVYKSNVLNSYVRGQIVFISEVDGNVVYDVHASDHGCTEKNVPLDCIRKPVYNATVPPLATHCQLADCKPLGETWSEKTIEAMKYYIGKEKAKMIVREKTPNLLVVELINTCPDDIATMLALTGYSHLGYAENVISRFTTPACIKHYFTYKDIKIDDVLHVRVQSGNSLNSFYVCSVKDYKHYLNERDNFTYFSKKQKDFCIDDLKVNRPVGVFIDSTCKYERGIIKEITEPDKKVKVQLVDWGSIVEVDLSRMKPMSEKFFFYPAIAIYCATEDNQIWDNGLHRFLYPGYEFLITIKKIGDKFNTPNIVNLSPV